MDVSNFNEKLNKLDGKNYVIEEEVTLNDGIYEAELAHDNITISTLNVYTGSKLTGDKINTYITSTPSLTPWKIVIKIYSNVSTLYISYETTGDQIEAEDINKLQDSVLDTQNNLNNEIDRATNRENDIESNLNSEISRAKSAESTLTSNLNTTNTNLNSEITRTKNTENTITSNLTAEVNRATSAENILTNNLNSEITRAKGAESTLTTNLNSEITRSKSAENTLTTNLNSEVTRATVKEAELVVAIDNRYTKDLVYTKDEVLAKIEGLINNAPSVLDTFKEIADALGNDPTFATTMTTLLSNKVDKVTGKALSTNDYTDSEKANVSDCNDKKHTHGNKSIIDIITQALIDNWNVAYTHISDTVKHITATERTLWNTVSNKLDSNANAVSASKLATSRIISLTGDVTGSASFDGSANQSITTTVSDNSHNHTSSTITDFLATVRATVLTGVSTATNSIISATDTVLVALGKLQAQITTNLSTLTNHTGNTSNPHSTTASQVGLGNVTNDSQVKRSEMGVANGVATLDSLGVNSQAPKSHAHDDRYYTETEADTKYVAKVDLGTYGYGDMMKSTYDTNGDGIVDNADKLDGKHASEFASSTHNHDSSYMKKGPITWNDLEGV